MFGVCCSYAGETRKACGGIGADVGVEAIANSVTTLVTLATAVWLVEPFVLVRFETAVGTSPIGFIKFLT